jgi:hypothetical protein
MMNHLCQLCRLILEYFLWAADEFAKWDDSGPVNAKCVTREFGSG